MRPCVFGISDLTNGLATALHNAGRNLRSEFLKHAVSLAELRNRTIESVLCLGYRFSPQI